MYPYFWCGSAALTSKMFKTRPGPATRRPANWRLPRRVAPNTYSRRAWIADFLGQAPAAAAG